MSPVSVNTSRSTRALESGEAKLWVVLVGVNHYADSQLSNLAYPALDCQGLGDALATATEAFPQKSIVLHHDHPQAPSNSSPDLASVRTSLQQIIDQAKPQDTILVYFSGHGVVDPPTQQTFLCLANTQKEQLLQTGLPVQELLATLADSAAHQQLVWLDACHSGGMSMQLGSKDETPEILPNPTPQLMALLRQRAAQSKGFYALLSCDQNQQSWEFPELEHGVFTYYLIQGLLGEAADDDGVIEADTLYKYVYYQTLRYIDKVNQQLRLINQQKRGRGETQLDAEYPQQTPKRIVEGVGELVLGLQPELPVHAYPRQALMVAGLADNPTALALGKVLRGTGAFELTYFPKAEQTWQEVREAIQSCLQVAEAVAPTTVTTALLYLRGKTEQTETGEAHLVLPEGVAISRSWLRQMLKRSPLAQQVVILDCPGATDLLDWIEDLQTHYQGQCLLAAAAPVDQPEQFAEILHETLTQANAQEGMPVASWIARLQTQLAGSEMQLHTWLSGVQGVIEVLPGGMGARSTTSDFDLGICPYMGLRAFGTDDAPFFFGREVLTQQLIEAVREQSFLAVVGASGSGKSSVVQAGLMAQLQQGQHIPSSDQWWMRSLRPGAKPVQVLVERLIESGTAKEQQYQRLQLEGMLYQGTEGFVYWLRSQPQSTIVLVIDQFEELFTLAAPEDRQQFLDLIFGAIDHAGDRFKLIITLRSDFIAPCLEYPALAQRLPEANILVPPALTTDSYRQVILNPAEQVGLAVAPELVEVLLEELSNLAGDLPLLEFVLEQLWEQRQPGALTLAIYQQQIGGLKGALERKAQDIYDSFDADGQACAQWIFLALTQLGDGTEDTRRRIKKSDLVVPKYPAALVEGTLKALTDAKLVIVSLDQDLVPDKISSSKGDEASDSSPPDPEDWLEWIKQDVTVEVVHEILIRHWSTLRWWLEENRVRLQTQRQIEQAAEDWQQSQQSSDFLLRGVRLDAAAELYVKYTDELSAEVQAFVQAGLSAQEQEQKQAKQRLRRAQVAVGIISLLGAAATGLAGMAFLQRQQTQLSEIRALNALSESQLRSHQQLEALLTSTQAARQFQSLWGWGIDGNTLGAIRTQTALTLGDAIAKTQERNRLEGHTQRVTSVSISSSGQWIASGSDDQTVRVWQANGKQLHTLEIGEKVNDVAFSPDDQSIAVITTQGMVQSWSPKTGKQLSSFTASSHGTGLAFHPQGNQLATAGRESVIKLWEASTGKLVKTLSGHQGWVNAVAFNATGTVLVSASEDKTVRIWDVAQGQTLHTLPKQATAVTDIAISSDGQTIASSTEDGTIQLWTLTGKRLRTFQTENVVVTSVAFSPDGSTLVSTHADHSLRLWQVETGKPLSVLQGHGAATLDAAFYPNGKTLVSASVDKQVRVWATPSIFEAVSIILAMAVSPDQQTLAIASLDGKIQLWRSDPQVGQLPFKSFNGDLKPVYALRFSADSQQLVSGHDKAIRVWDIHEGTVQRTLSGHRGKINSLDFSPNGKTLVSGSDDQTIRLWDAATGKTVKTIQAHDGPVTSVDFGPRYLASGSDDETVKLWQLDGTPVKTLTGHGLAIAQVQFNSAGDILASASWDNTIKLWQDKTLVQTLTGHQNGVMSLAFLPDQPILISGSPDQSVKVWQVDQGTLLKTLDGLGPVTRVNVKDKQIWVGTGATLQKANIDLDVLLEKGCRHLSSYLTTTANLLPSQRQCSE